MGPDATGWEDEPGGERASPAVSPEALKALASPTLAALYASQGHGEMAAAIYAQLDPQAAPVAARRSAGETDGDRPAPRRILEQLLALRQAARRRREAAGAAPRGMDIEDGRHAR